MPAINDCAVGTSFFVLEKARLVNISKTAIRTCTGAMCTTRTLELSIQTWPYRNQRFAFLKLSTLSLVPISMGSGFVMIGTFTCIPQTVDSSHCNCMLGESVVFTWGIAQKCETKTFSGFFIFTSGSTKCGRTQTLTPPGLPMVKPCEALSSLVLVVILQDEAGIHEGPSQAMACQTHYIHIHVFTSVYIYTKESRNHTDNLYTYMYV